uniref:hypothetical protein n=1 Tax=Paraclostridium bifermentans TaxID=1490 RepID=UPI00374FDA39
MKESYYIRIKNFINKKRTKNIIYVLSPTYFLYDSMRIESNKDYKIELANNIKLFFLSLSLFIISMISIYDISHMDGKSNIIKISYILLCTIPM